MGALLLGHNQEHVILSTCSVLVVILTVPTVTTTKTGIVGMLVTTALLLISFLVTIVEGGDQVYDDLENQLDNILDKHVGEMFDAAEESVRKKRQA